MDPDFLKIHVEIAGKEYGLTINRSEEELVRKAAKQIHHKLNQYRNHFAKQSDITEKDLLSMVALQLSIENLKLEDKNDTAPFADKILQLTSELEHYLEEE